MVMTMNESHLDTVLLLARARVELVRDIDRGSSSHGLSLSDLALLRQLASEPDGRMRRTDLARALGVTTSNVARQLGPLERMGMVDRESNPKDARLALVVLTEAGTRVEREASAIAEERAKTALDRTWTAEQQATVAELLALAVPH